MYVDADQDWKHKVDLVNGGNELWDDDGRGKKRDAAEINKRWSNHLKSNAGHSLHAPSHIHAA